MESSHKKMNILKNVLREEMKLHYGSGINGKCLIDDVAEIMHIARGTFANSGRNQAFYTVSREQCLSLCDAWGIRSEYLCGIDNIRTNEDLYNSFDDALKQKFKNTMTFCKMLGYDVHLLTRHIDDYGISERIEIKPNDENITKNKSCLTFDIYKDNLKICTINCFELSDMIKTLLDNASNILNIYFSDKQELANICNNHNQYINYLLNNKAVE